MRSVQIRASSWSELFDCPKRWAAQHIDGHKLPTSAPAHLGTALHAGTALYDAAPLVGAKPSVDDAITRALDVLGEDDNVDWGTSSFDKAANIIATLLPEYAHQWAYRNPYAYVELPVEPLVVPVGGVQIELTGTVDRVRRVGGQYGVDDLKTGAQVVYASGYVPSGYHKLQLGVYELLVEHTLKVTVELPARVVALQTRSPYAIASGEIAGGKSLIEGDADNWGALEHGARIIAAGDFAGNPRSGFCKKQYCPVWASCRWRQ